MSDPSTPRNTDEQPGPRDTAGQPSARAPIPRGKRARERVLRAALEVLADQGLPGFTMEAVAHRAGASKATVYRHWTSQATLLVDAMELVSRLEALVSDQPFPRLVAAFIDAAERDPTRSNLHVQLTERRREPLRHVLAQARQRGDSPSTTDLEEMLRHPP